MADEDQIAELLETVATLAQKVAAMQAQINAMNEEYARFAMVTKSAIRQLCGATEVRNFSNAPMAWPGG